MATGVLDFAPYAAPVEAHPAAAVEPLGHRPALDGLRGLALALVLLTHTAPPLTPGGYIALEIFFVMSAFLITTLLLEEHQRNGRVHLRHFYLRRALRLVPALLVMLASVWAITLIGRRWADLPRLATDTACILGYCHNWRLVFHPNWHDFTFQLCPCWSLAIEEQFYLTWPLVLTALLALRARWAAVAVAVAGVLVPPLLRPGAWTGPESFQTLYFSTHLRIDGIALGCLLAMARCWWPSPLGAWGRPILNAAAWLSAGVLLFFLFGTTMFDAMVYNGGLEVVNLASAVLVAALLRPPPLLAAFFQAWPLQWLGRISYGAYLWNMIIFCLVMYETPFLARPGPIGPLHTPGWTHAPLIWAGTLLAGAASWYLVERPFLRLKARFAPEQPSAG